MGAISFTIDQALVRELQKLLGFTNFVETGTFRGESLAAVHRLFPHCLSVELSPEYHAAAANRFAAFPQVTVLLGDSPKVLAERRATYAGKPTLFWLDAHWCAAENSAGEKSQCPLLEEISAIGRIDARSAILIDDARLFLGPPPKPHEISAWPTLDAVYNQLRKVSSDHALLHYNDVLVFVPAEILPALRSFLQAHTVNLLTLADKARDYDRVLADSKQKDVENENLQAFLKERETELERKHEENNNLQATLKERNAEIENLAKAAEERLATIMELDAGVKGLRAELHAARGTTAPGASSLVDEVAAIRLQLASARLQLATKQRELAQLRLAIDRRPGQRKRAGAGPSWLQQWRASLVDTTPNPLGKLRQYEPRPLVREKFPRPPKLARWPRICLLTPSYQQAAFLETTMLSVLDQNYPNLAYGVQDGGSTDGSADIITRHVPRLTHAESAPDAGQSDAINRGFAKLYPVNSDIMGWLNSDDLLMPGALHYIGAYFARHPEVDVIYGHRVIIDEQDQETGRWYLPQYHPDTLRWFDLVPQETVFWRASCYQEIGGLDPTFQFALDWDLLLRFEQAGFAIRRVPYFLGCFRVHAQQKTSAHISTVGEGEMAKLRRRTHGREVLTSEVQKHLDEEISRSALVEWLHRWGIRR